MPWSIRWVFPALYRTAVPLSFQNHGSRCSMAHWSDASLVSAGTHLPHGLAWPDRAMAVTKTNAGKTTFDKLSQAKSEERAGSVTHHKQLVRRKAGGWSLHKAGFGWKGMKMPTATAEVASRMTWRESHPVSCQPWPSTLQRVSTVQAAVFIKLDACLLTWATEPWPRWPLWDNHIFCNRNTRPDLRH